MSRKRRFGTLLVAIALLLIGVAGTTVVGASGPGADACDPAMGSAADGVTANTGCGDSPSDDPGGGGGDGGDGGMDCQYFCLPQPLPQP